MALDGIFLLKIKNEIIEKAQGLRVDKVHQPSKEEIILQLRGKKVVQKLLLCVRADSPRVHFTAHTIENPAAPPMFCMLMRKYLLGAMLTGVRQHENDRILFLDFLGTNEIGDKQELTICIEIMSKYSNLILLKDGKVVDSAKRVDLLTSSVRQILPNIEYQLPPAQDKLSLEKEEVETVLQKILSLSEKPLSNAIMNCIQGVSPIISRELAHRASFSDVIVGEMKNEQVEILRFELQNIKNMLSNSSEFFMVCEDNGRPKDFSHMDIRQYSGKMQVKAYSNASELLDAFYFERDRINRTNTKGHELIKLVSNLIERTRRKIEIQKQELIECENKEEKKLFGELILANLYKLEKGVTYYEVENYYDDYKMIKIPCSPALEPSENQMKYYKEYRKAQTAEKMLATLIEEGKEEQIYLESVLDSISRADLDAELMAIRQELYTGGYVKTLKTKKQKALKELPPHKFKTTDGYEVLVGRNNVQNEKLSMKQANNNDMWLHVQKMPGSHVIIANQGGEVSDQSIEEAAKIAAHFSKASDSSIVTVDYTNVRHLKKPNGGKAGMVIYHEYYSINVNTDKDFVESLRV
ncbi:MAG: NFACT RNA binding domain-containing protein [Clostridia bacterium]